MRPFNSISNWVFTGVGSTQRYTIHRMRPRGNQFDLAWMGHILHFFAPQDGIALLRRVRRALAPGGTLIVHEVIADEGRCASAAALLGALWLCGVSEAGDIYTCAELRTWLEQAGFVGVTLVGEEYIKAMRP